MVLDGFYRWNTKAQLQYEGAYRDGVRDGVWRVYVMPSERIVLEMPWRGGRWHGIAARYHRNGQRESQGRYVKGEKHGEWRFWFPTGQIAARGEYEHDQQVGDWSYWDEQGE